jgi:CheY-like chemotaxis protein
MVREEQTAMPVEMTVPDTSSHPASRLSKRPPKILVVEDDPSMARSVVQGLAASGFATEVAADARTALDRILSGELSLVLLDLNLGGSDGLSVLASCRSRVVTPFIVLSGKTTLDARLREGGTLELPFPARENLAVLVMAGEVIVNGEHVAATNDFVLFKNEGEVATIKAQRAAHLLVLGGEPIDEPVVQYGPFVMNTKQEIAQAYDDFRRGKFGYLAD